MKWNWGTGIAATYIAFAVATSGFVVFAMSRPVSLVRPDYYAESLREDQLMAARRNAQQLGSAVSIAAEGRDVIRVAVPAHAGATITGTVTLYRAADPAADRTFTFSPDARGVQDLPVAHLAAGHWIVKLQWTADGHDYYVEQPIVLP
jgi:hypothetical protein